MCGICGIYNFHSEEKVYIENLKKMNNLMVHRGPDDEGYYLSNNSGIAMRRLSIIDVEGGHQPIHNENKTIYVVCNGEIYNFKFLKNELEKKGHKFYTKSDTEVIVHLYEEKGENFIVELNGMFGLALWDENNKKLILARDHIGIKPLYYYIDNKGIIFGSEIKTILCNIKKPEINFEALSHYLSFLYVTTPYSIYKNIYKLTPGHLMIITPGNHKIKKYWEIKYNINNNYKENEVINELEELIEKNVESHLISDVPLGAFLSSGLDSSIVVYYMQKILKSPVKTFTIGFQEKSFDETPEAKLIANSIGTEHTELIIKPEIENLIDYLITFYDEPFADYSSIPFYYVSKLAREKVKVALTGDGGDELFGGYQTFLAQDVIKIYKIIPAFIRNKIIKKILYLLPTSFDRISFDFMAKRFVNGCDLSVPEAHYFWKVIFNLNEKLNLFNEEYKQIIAKFDSVNLYNNLYNSLNANIDLKNKLMFIDYSTLLFDDILPKSDRMSMANSLEVRVPLCSRDVINFSAKIPGDLKTKYFTTKYLFRKIAKKYLPKKITSLRKKGFSPPIAYWLYNDLKDYTNEVLSKDNINSIGLFNYSYINRIVNEHLKKQKDNNRKIWALIIFVRWWYNYYCKL
ncbi:MAG TPA: asparagine synthase (glutamine-hydrolyzing) [bacterium]|nr:asparagine synthase (glutamine-hydrolyzing) [bacterium]HOL48385.1 asparagine synthase (glutamine-hydrolyzing) [bacterium]HPQ19706.1 asparagine synthase (glutamine-hydrolyzing) [bacterium]